MPQPKAPDTPQPPPPDPKTRYTPQAPEGSSVSGHPGTQSLGDLSVPRCRVIIYLIIGFVFGWWHPGWVIFLTIPIYYWIVRVVEDDPNWQASHDDTSSRG